jgi:hypothetical protein
MLDLIAAIGGGLFVLASLVVGGRVMALARRTRGAPELVLGAALFLMGGLGYPLTTVAVQAESLSDGTRSAMLVGTMVANVVGMTGLGWFTRHVFRPGVGWAKVLWLAVVATYLTLATTQIVGPGLMAFIADPETGPWHASNYLSVVLMTWAGIESFRYWTMQKKRLALGLADPVVADRFRLWALAILTADGITVLSSAFELAGVTMVGTAIGSIIVGFLGLFAAAFLWLAFVPNERYLARVRARAEGSA